MAQHSFEAEDFLPKTGLPHERQGEEIANALAERLAVLRAVYIHNPRHLPVFAGLDELRALGRKTKGRPQAGVRCLADSGAGKTSTAEAYQRHVHKTVPMGSTDQPVVIAALASAVTVRSTWVCVLEALGDQMIRRADTEEMLRRRAYAAFEHFNVQLLIVDEIQHLDSGPKARVDVTDSLKRILDSGRIPVAFFGTSEARPMLMRNNQLANRMLPALDIKPFKPSDGQDRADHLGVLRRLDREMVELGLMQEPANLDQGPVAKCIMEVSGGLIGRSAKLIQMAYSSAFRRDATRIELRDLSRATDIWAVDGGLVKHNPFVRSTRQGA